jgi:hypothetical protein
MKSKPQDPKSLPLNQNVLIRDLMKAIYRFGLVSKEIPCVTDRETAMKILKEKKDFFAYPGGDTVYKVSPQFYESVGIAQTRVREKLESLFPLSPEAMGL